MSKRKKGKNANYNFQKDTDPAVPMGHGDFANLPSNPKYLKYVNKPGYRGGIINSLTCDVEEVSDIYENRRQE